MKKVCTKCSIEKEVSEFSLQKSGRLGVKSWCKNCCAVYRKDYYSQNKEHELSQNTEWRSANQEKMSEIKRQWNQENIEHNRIVKRLWVGKNKEKALGYWRNKNNKRKGDPIHSLNRKMRFGIYRSLRGNKNNQSWVNMVDYTFLDLERHLKSTIPDGYSWESFFNGALHIDHIIPISVHNFKKSTDTDFRRCWSLKNLRLLPAQENLSKGAKLDRPFQPSLF